ncbi:hypothetical protein B0H11DRAFT_1934785 [Mycena galericulata]|nr:hypothetical protein B0H11DRAFT_1934785 [Mycena galericulata]
MPPSLPFLIHHTDDQPSSYVCPHSCRAALLYYVNEWHAVGVLTTVPYGRQTIPLDSALLPSVDGPLGFSSCRPSFVVRSRGSPLLRCAAVRPGVTHTPVRAFAVTIIRGSASVIFGCLVS